MREDLFLFLYLFPARGPKDIFSQPSFASAALGAAEQDVSLPSKANRGIVMQHTFELDSVPSLACTWIMRGLMVRRERLYCI